MRFFLYIATVFLLFAAALNANERYNRIVDISVVIDSSGMNKKFILAWNNGDTNAAKYIISRKLKNENKWFVLDTLDGKIGTYTDIPPGSSNAYEYGIVKTTKDSSYFGYGYIYTGYDLSLTYDRGIALLLVDGTLAYPLKDEIDRFALDLTGDGYFVIKKYVERTEQFYSPAVSRTKQVIEKIQNEYGNQTITLILLGRVAVPYAGNTAWDGHHPVHSGAWGSDLYYGVPRTYWNDYNVLNNKPDRTENKNIPYDGKFDQSVISKTELRMGRIDMFNLPLFRETEIELLRRYLRKNHDFRHRKFRPRMKALLDDGFGNYLPDEAVASCGWLNFAALLGTGNVDTLASFRYGMQDSSFIWAYGCNMGAYDNIYHTVYTTELSKLPYQSVFTMLLGSYAGDWDSENNVLRATIASEPSMLGTIWAGRPFIFFHHMALGEPIGFSVFVSQNNVTTYRSNGNKGLRASHVELLGDPSLRMTYPAPPVNFTITNDTVISGKRKVTLQWEKPDDDIVGYILFRADSLHGKYTKIHKGIIKDFKFTDDDVSDIRPAYMLRSVKREISVSGSYYNLSEGVFCQTRIPDGISNKISHTTFKIFPNPSQGHFYIDFHTATPQTIKYTLYDTHGKKITESQSEVFTSGNHILEIGLSNLSFRPETGIYFIALRIGSKIYFGKLSIIN